VYQSPYCCITVRLCAVFVCPQRVKQQSLTMFTGVLSSEDERHYCTWRQSGKYNVCIRKTKLIFIPLPTWPDWLADVSCSQPKGPFIATQLKSTRRRVELSCVSEVSIATRWRNSTQLDVELSTRSQREQLSLISSERRDPVKVSIAMQLNSIQLDVELSWVELRRRSVYSDPPTQLNSTSSWVASL